jgi:hypothetical protein
MTRATETCETQSKPEDEKMTTLYICGFDCRGKINLAREEFAGPSYPRDRREIKRTVLRNDGTLHPRHQENQWHGGTDDEAIARAEAAAADYMTVEG